MKNRFPRTSDSMTTVEIRDSITKVINEERETIAKAVDFLVDESAWTVVDLIDTLDTVENLIIGNEDRKQLEMFMRTIFYEKDQAATRVMINIKFAENNEMIVKNFGPEALARIKDYEEKTSGMTDVESGIFYAENVLKDIDALILEGKIVKGSVNTMKLAIVLEKIKLNKDSKDMLLISALAADIILAMEDVAIQLYNARAEVEDATVH